MELTPERAKAAAEAVIGECDDHPAARVLAMRTLGLATRFLDGPNPAVVVLREAVRIASKHNLPQSLAEAKMTYAALLADLGQINAALTECDEAAALLRGTSGVVISQRAMILSRASRAEEALADYAKALPLLRAARDIHSQCRLYINRSNLLAYLGRLPAAQRDLQTGIELARTHGLDNATGSMIESLGFVMVRRGDIPAALRLFAESLTRAYQYNRFNATYDRAEALLIAGLAGEARDSLEALISDVANAGFAVDVAEWHQMLAHAALAEGDPKAARDYAEQALAEFRSQGR
ncbi:MAG TPA: hypothetical protein VF218_01125, partial [Acidothermaceae bacterium]